jgi:hypothetical protein
MPMGDVEGEAAWLLRDFERAPGARALVARHLGEGSILVVPGLRGGDAKIHTVNHRPTICVRAKLGKESLRWAILHELAEWHLQRVGYRGEDVELVAEALTAALVVPRRDYQKALRTHGERWEQLAIDFSTTQTCVALRHGEVTDEPLAVIAPATVRVRGREWTWPEERAIRLLARAERPGLRRAKLTDDPRRVVLVADDVG